MSDTLVICILDVILLQNIMYKLIINNNMLTSEH